MNEWISVTDQRRPLPEQNVLVVVAIRGNESRRYVTIASYAEVLQRWISDSIDYTDEITHWMPLPDLPCVDALGFDDGSEDA